MRHEFPLDVFCIKNDGTLQFKTYMLQLSEMYKEDIPSQIPLRTYLGIDRGGCLTWWSDKSMFNNIEITLDQFYKMINA